MAEKNKILYVVVVDEEVESSNMSKKKKKKRDGKESFRYTRPLLQSTLILIHCKPHHAFEISKRVFEVLTTQSLKDAAVKVGQDASSSVLEPKMQDTHLVQPDSGAAIISSEGGERNNLPSELYKRQTTIVISRDKFLDVACDALAEYNYVGPNQRADLILACRVREKKESVSVLLRGINGCGKSTLSSLLVYDYGVTTVVSRDSPRDIVRNLCYNSYSTT